MNETERIESIFSRLGWASTVRVEENAYDDLLDDETLAFWLDDGVVIRKSIVEKTYKTIAKEWTEKYEGWVVEECRSRYVCDGDFCGYEGEMMELDRFVHFHEALECACEALFKEHYKRAAGE